VSTSFLISLCHGFCPARVTHFRRDFRSISGMKIIMAVILFAGLALRAPNVTHAQSSLLPDGGFESGSLTGWEVCGGIAITEPDPGPLAVHSGSHALRIGNPSDDSCGAPFPATQMSAKYRGIRVPSGASNLTLSLWYSRVGDFGANSSFWTLTVILVTSDGGPEIRILDTIKSDETSGWNNARWELSPADAARVAGRRFDLQFSVPFALLPDNDLAYYIDDLEIIPGKVRTPITAQVPAALADDNTQPLVGIGIVNGQQRALRGDTDGSDIRVVGAPRAGGTIFEARWSADGQRIAIREDTLKPEPGENPSVTWAQISTLTVADATGGNAREVYRTPGKRLVPGNPPGCRAPRTDCVRVDDPANDLKIGEHHWSPDGRQLALSECGWMRYADGSRDGTICRITIIDAATGAVQAEIPEALGGSWSVASRLLYRISLNVANLPKGIYESSSPPQGTLLYTHKSETNPQEDVGLSWSPDSRHFATLRFVPGSHYDENGVARFNSAIMLFDRLNPTQPQQLLLVDFGSAILHPTFSPDGKYVIFTLQRHDDTYDTRWLEIESGETGLLNESIVLAEWRPAAGGGNPLPTPTPRPTTPVTLNNKIRLPLVRR
jgi:WD40 repeat protein